MKKKLLIIFISLIVISVAFWRTNGFGVLKSATAFAIGDLVVDWGIGTGDVGPIFNITGMAPGQTVSRVVNVSNSGSGIRPLAVRGIQTATDSAGLANVLDITISNGGVDLYGGSSPTGPKTLQNFFIESQDPSGIDLLNLNPTSSVDLTIKVKFQESAGNEYQNQSLMFNITIGIGFDLPTQCENMTFLGDPIFGTSGSDNISGGNGGKLIITFEGNDNVRGGNGNDCIISGPGQDAVAGNNGNDVIDTGNGNDAASGGNGEDVIILGEGNDSADGGTGADLISAGGGVDNVNGGDGNDQITLGEGIDNASGGLGNDNIDGQGGNDLIAGGNGNDTLTGGLGVDTATGNAGTDTCNAETEVGCEL
jgi:Ca2+-binding RTX toxin-like protein